MDQEKKKLQDLFDQENKILDQQRQQLEAERLKIGQEKAKIQMDNLQLKTEMEQLQKEKDELEGEQRRIYDSAIENKLYVDNEVARRLRQEIENYDRNKLIKAQEDDYLDSEMLDAFTKGREKF